MILRRTVCCAAVLLGLSACSSNNTDDGTTGAAPPPPPPATTTTTSTSLVLTTEGPPTKAGIDARVKAEVDNRSDGITGKPLPVAGARASLQTPTEWKTTNGAIAISAAADNKAQLAATALGAESISAKLPAVATALGLTGCEWNPADSLNIGKSTLPGEAADGLCTRGSTKVHTAYVSPRAEGLLVVGAWEDGGDSANVFGAMRTITKAAGGGDASGIGACCAALRQNANSAPPDQKANLLTAAGVCDGIKNSPQGRAALAQVRAMLRGANMPSSCR